jgi:predicted nuclease with TOPRIM domain
VIEPQVLSNPELRVVLGQLYELKALRIEIKELQSNREAEIQQYEAEKAIWQQRIELEKQAYELAKERVAMMEKENSLMAEKVTFYKTSYEVCVSNKKTSGWCKVKRIFTLGIARCK